MWEGYLTAPALPQLSGSWWPLCCPLEAHRNWLDKHTCTHTPQEVPRGLGRMTGPWASPEGLLPWGQAGRHMQAWCPEPLSLLSVCRSCNLEALV